MSRSWDELGDRLAAGALAAGDATGWFEELYRAGVAGEVDMPWSRREPHWTLRQWAEERHVGGAGRRAIVVGAGLGADAAYVARLGFETVAFDISPTAIATARERFPDAGVEFVCADLLDPPQEWTAAFDFVVEIITLQALPATVRGAARANVARLVAPAGTLLVVSSRRDDAEPPAAGPPWPATRAEIESFAEHGLSPVAIEALTDPGDPAQRRWRAEFTRD